MVTNSVDLVLLCVSAMAFVIIRRGPVAYVFELLLFRDFFGGALSVILLLRVYHIDYSNSIIIIQLVNSTRYIHKICIMILFYLIENLSFFQRVYLKYIIVIYVYNITYYNKYFAMSANLVTWYQALQ